MDHWITSSLLEPATSLFLFLHNVFSFFLILFSPDVSKGSIINVFDCLSISSRYRTSPKHKMRVSSPDMVIENRTEQFTLIAQYLTK